MTITDTGSTFLAGLLVGGLATAIIGFVGWFLGWSSRTVIACIASALAAAIGYFVLFAAPNPTTAGPSLGSVAMRAATGIWFFLYGGGWLAGTVVVAYVLDKLPPRS